MLRFQEPSSAILRAAQVLLVAVLAACDDGRGALHRASAHVLISATTTRVGETVSIIAGYIPPGGARVPLTTRTFAAGGSPTQQLSVSLDITECLANPAVAASGAGCPLVLAVVLRDSAGFAVDSQTVGPLVLLPGQRSQLSTGVVLQTPATLTIEAGDSQVGVVGQPLLDTVIVRLTDRVGIPIAGRKLTVTAVTGGGTLLGNAPPTDSTGRTRLVLRLGATSGAQQFRVATVGGAAVASLLNAQAIPPSNFRLGVTLTDGDFAFWAFGSTGTATVTAESSSGNPGSRLNVTTISGAAVYGTAVNNLWSTTEALEGQPYTFGIEFLSGPGAFNDGQSVHLVLRQRGLIYARNLGITGTNFAGWTEFTRNGTLNAVDFTLFAGPGPQHPDLSGGTETTFGFAGGNLLSGTLTNFYDNVRLRVGN